MDSPLFDGAKCHSHTVSLRRVLVHASLRSLLPVGFPHELLTPPEADPFSESTPARVSAATVCFELAGPPVARLATCHGAPARCVRPTSASHCLDYEHPCLVSYRHLFEACAPPVIAELALGTQRPVNLAFHDARSASVGFVGLALGVSLPSASARTAPLTSLSLPVLPHSAFARASSTRIAKAAAIAPP